MALFTTGETEWNSLWLLEHLGTSWSILELRSGYHPVALRPASQGWFFHLEVPALAWPRRPPAGNGE